MLNGLKLKLFGRRRIPGTAISANINKQSNCNNGSRFHRNTYYSEEIICKDCGIKFIFTAEKMKEYYENGGNVYAKINRCEKCYRLM